MSIPDKAVEAGAEELKHWSLPKSPEFLARAVLEAAEPYLTPALDRDKSIERLLDKLQDANRRDMRALAAQGWVGIPEVPEDGLRQHCTHLVDALLAPEVKS